MAGATTAIPDLTVYDTGPKLLRYNAEHRGERPAMREKDLGIWQSWTWAEIAVEVRALACGLKQAGIERGDKVSIVGDNRPRLYWSMVAAQAIGAIPVPVYQDSVADEMQYVLDHAGSRFAVVENQEQVDKLIQIKDRCPALEHVIYCDPRGLRNYTEEFLESYSDCIAAGKAFDTANPDFYDREVETGKGSDVSIYLYTSGTTGRPKGVVLTHHNILSTSAGAVEFEGLNENDEMLAYLPMAWIGDHIFSFGQAYTSGFCVACPESADTVLNDIWELGPSYFFATPRIFESLLTTVMIGIEDASKPKQRMFHYFMKIAKTIGPKLLDGERLTLGERLLYFIGNLLVYAPLKNTLGMSKVRIAYTAGEAISPDIFDFYRSLGLNLKQLYGMTESSVFITIQPNGEIKSDTVGIPAPGVDVKIDGNGEVMFKSAGIFQEYYKNPEATAEMKTEDGWCHTGDAGFFDANGHLKIIDRAKDVGRLNNGTMLAPKYIENKLKFFPNILEAVVFGDGRDYTAAFINIDLQAMGNWAERNGIAYASYQELAALPQVYDLIQEHLAQSNRDLAEDAELAGSQVKRFLILHKELDADDGEVTRTGKVRRRAINEKYGPLIDALYSDVSHCEIETEVTFEDGRTGSIKADLEIREAETTEAVVAQAAE